MMALCPSSTLAGQVAVVTGASRGAGRQVALQLAERVFGGDRVDLR